ncbi:MAG: hypothetical protein MJ249_07300 [Kiritimatiellae bacterium]|nr:hypothetical protein [Kiritimatiellia bacterium]
MKKMMMMVVAGLLAATMFAKMPPPPPSAHQGPQFKGCPMQQQAPKFHRHGARAQFRGCSCGCQQQGCQCRRGFQGRPQFRGGFRGRPQIGRALLCSPGSS